MGFKEVQSSFATPFVPKQVNDSIEGIYCGTDEVPTNVGEQESFLSYRILCDNDGHEEMMGVSGAMLASKFDQIPLNARVRVTYLGLQKMKSGMNAKNWKVEVDENAKLTRPMGRTMHKDL